eukprot:TRINITY_DN409_c0_g1_i2.p1 TRINITY_DN409_c0_g1~~TRINITY_DN409_c0_g1_i2.p1  ORF type:complete len:1763 (-),score=566.38 TRINITY_DN409_c0_g1_i2:291-5579(-)
MEGEKHGGYVSLARKKLSIRSRQTRRGSGAVKKNLKKNPPSFELTMGDGRDKKATRVEEDKPDEEEEGPEAHRSYMKDAPTSSPPKVTRKKRKLLSRFVKENPSSVDGLKISAVDQEIEEIDVLPETFSFVETLYLSSNRIRYLGTLTQFPHLRALSLANNQIDDFGELEKLQSFRSLRVLNLEFNPIHSLPYYRWHVIMRLPFLRMLDNKSVTDKERAKAPSIVRKEETTLDLMATNEVLIAKLKHGLEKIRLHDELRSVVFGRIGTLKGTEWLPLIGTVPDTRQLMKIWDSDPNYEMEDRAIVFARIREDVKRARNIRMFRGANTKGPTLDDIRPVDEKKGTKKMPLSTTAEFWDLAYADVMLMQQNGISSSLGSLEEENDKISKQLKAMEQYDPIRILQAAREDGAKRETRLREERERILRGFRDAASGMHKGKTGEKAKQSKNRSRKIDKDFDVDLEEDRFHDHRPDQLDEEDLALIQAQHDIAVSRLLSAHSRLSRRDLEEQPKPFTAETTQTEFDDEEFQEEEEEREEEEFEEEAREQENEESMSSRVQRQDASSPKKGSRYMQALRKSMVKPKKERSPPVADESDPRPQVSAPTPMTMDELGRETRQLAAKSRRTTARVPEKQKSATRTTKKILVHDSEELESMRKQVEMLQTDIERRVEDEARLQRLNAQLRERLEMYQSQNRENIDKAEEELLSMQKELESAMEEQSNAKAEADIFRREKDALEKRLQAMEADWEKHTKEYAMRIGSLEKGLTGKDRDIITVHAERMKLEQDKEDLEKERQELSSEVTEMRERIRAAEEENNFLRQKAEEYMKEVNDLLRKEELEARADSLFHEKVTRKMFYRLKRAVEEHQIAKEKTDVSNTFFHFKVMQKCFRNWRIHTARECVCAAANDKRIASVGFRCLQSWIILSRRARYIRSMENRRREKLMVAILRSWIHWNRVRQYDKKRGAVAQGVVETSILRRYFGKLQRQLHRYEMDEEEEREKTVKAIEHNWLSAMRKMFSSWVSYVLVNCRKNLEDNHTALQFRKQCLAKRTLGVWKTSFNREQQYHNASNTILSSRVISLKRECLRYWRYRMHVRMQDHAAREMAVSFHTRTFLRRWMSFVETSRQRKTIISQCQRVGVRVRARMWWSRWRAYFEGKNRMHQLHLSATDRYLSSLMGGMFSKWNRALHRQRGIQERERQMTMRCKQDVFSAWQGIVSRKKRLRECELRCQRLHEDFAIQTVRQNFVRWVVMTRKRVLLRLGVVDLQKRIGLRAQRRALLIWMQAYQRNLLYAFRKMQDGFNDMKGEVAKREEAAGKVSMENMELIDQIQKLMAEGASMKEKVSSREEQLREVHEQMEEQLIHMNSLKTEMEEMRLRNEDLQRTVARLQQGAEIGQDEISSSVVEQRMEIQEARRRIEELEAGLDEARNEVMRFQDALEEKQGHVSVIEEQSHERLASTMEVVSQLRKMVQERDSQIAELKASLEHSSIALTDAHAQLGQTGESMAARLRESEDVNAKLRDTIKVMQEEHIEMASRCQQYASELDEREALIKRLRYELQLASDREHVQTSQFLSTLGIRRPTTMGYSTAAAHGGVGGGDDGPSFTFTSSRVPAPSAPVDATPISGRRDDYEGTISKDERLEVDVPPFDRHSVLEDETRHLSQFASSFRSSLATSSPRHSSLKTRLPEEVARSHSPSPVPNSSDDVTRQLAALKDRLKTRLQTPDAHGTSGSALRTSDLAPRGSGYGTDDDSRRPPRSAQSQVEEMLQSKS